MRLGSYPLRPARDGAETVPDDLELSAGDLFEELGEGLGEDRAPALLESSTRLVVPKKGGLWDADGNGKVAVIRPCVSRGKRIRGLPPIYTPAMLAENANVFAGWPMYLDHLVEEALRELAEELREFEDLSAYLEERARSVKDLGGRILESYFDTELSFSDDGDQGYQKGGVVGKYRPQPKVREMLDADPEILNVSINAWPKGARVGTAPWSAGTRGMMIEGIRRKPMGSVDFVFKGGAGGRPIVLEGEERERAVSLLEGLYASDPDRRTPKRNRKMKTKIADFKSRDELLEALREENPELAETIEVKAKGGDDAGDGTGLSEERVRELFEEFKSSGDFLTEEDVENRANELLEERDEARRLERTAHDKISEAVRNGLPEVWGAELRRRYAVLPSGPTAALLVEADEENGKSVDEVLEERLREDVRHIVSLIRASGGRAVVTGLGPSGEDEETGGEGKAQESSTEPNAFVDFLRESGDLEGDPEKDKTKLAEMAREGR